MLDQAHEQAGRQATWDPAERDGARRPYGAYEGMTIFEAARHS